MTAEDAVPLGEDQEDARLMPRLSTTKSTAPVTTAGRELDALIAEKVMGWRKDYNGVRWINKNENPTRYVNRVFSWAPSTDIKDAWLVVEKLREDGWSTGLTYMSLAEGWAWRCDLHHEDEGDVSDGFAPGAPLAICLAALKAVGA